MKTLYFLLAILISFPSFGQDTLDREYLVGLLHEEKLDELEGELRNLRFNDWGNRSCSNQAEIYKLYGNLYYYRYEDDKALQYYKDSAYLKVEQCDIPELENDLLNNIGIVCQFDKKLLAAKYYNKLRRNYLNRKFTPSEKAFQHLLNLGNFYDGHGDFYNSFLCSWKAKSVGELLNLPMEDVYNQLGIYFERTKKYENALEYYSLAIESFEKQNVQVPTSLLFNQALTYRYKRQFKASLDILNLLKQRKNDIEDEYAILNLEGIIYTQNGQYERAEQVFKKLDEYKIENMVIPYHRENYADLKLKTGKFSSAIRIYKESINKLEKGWSHLGTIPASSPSFMEYTDLLALTSKALYLQEKQKGTSNSEEISIYYKKIRSHVQDILNANWDSQSSSHLLDEIYPKLFYIIKSEIDKYHSSGNKRSAEKAYQMLSEFKNQFLKRDINSRRQLNETLADSLLFKYYTLKSALNNNIKDKALSKRSKTMQIVQRFEKYQSKLDSLSQNENGTSILSSLSLADIQTKLLYKEALLDLYFADGKLIIFCITKKDIQIKPTEISTSLLQEFIENIKSGEPIDQIINDSLYHCLYDFLDHSEIEKISINADGLFHNLPFEAIKNPNTGAFLIEQMSFRYLISTEDQYLVDYPWKNNKCLGIASEYKKEFLNTGDSINGIYNQLVGTLDEIQELPKHYSTTALINNEANYYNFSESLVNNDFNIIQLSLHGLIDDRFPALSGLIFENEHGLELIDLNKITGHNFNTDLTIVNSCHSGDGKHITGEALYNLNTSLFISGSKANVVNLWSSSDKASSQILKHFHSELSKGQSKSKSLQIAKKKFLAQASPSFRHPRYWSSLVIFGNDATFHKKNKALTYLILGLIIGLGFIFLKKTSK